MVRSTTQNTASVPIQYAKGVAIISATDQALYFHCKGRQELKRRTTKRKTKAAIHGLLPAKPIFFCRTYIIYPATNTTLTAMTASTDGCEIGLNQVQLEQK